MSTLYRATVTRIDGEGVFVEAPELGVGGEWGPLELLAIPLVEGDPVLVGSINEIPEDLVLMGKLVLDAPVANPSNTRFIYYFENEAARTAAALTLVSGLTTWLDDEQRLDVYTDEGTPGWVNYYGVKASKLLYVSGVKIGVGTVTPTSTLSVASASGSDGAFDTQVTGEGQRRLTVDVGGSFKWTDGTNTSDVQMYRNGTGPGLTISPRLGVGAGNPSTDASVTARQTADRAGYFSSNTDTGTRGFAHFHAADSGVVASNAAFRSFKTGDTQPLFDLKVNGRMNWGPGGSTVTDTNLYRGGVNLLSTDSDFLAGDIDVLDVLAGNISGSDLNMSNDGLFQNNLTAYNTLSVGMDFYLNGVFQGRGLYNYVADTNSSATLSTTTETIWLTLPTKTYLANRAYRVITEGRINTASSATFSGPSLRIRKNTTAGQGLLDFGIEPYPLNQNRSWPADHSGVFTVGATGVSATLLLCVQQQGAVTIQHVSSSSGSRMVSIYDIGPSFQYPNTPVLV